MRINKKIVSGILISIILLISSDISKAESNTPDLACIQPASTPSDSGTLVLAAQTSSLTSIEWGIKQGCFKKYGLNVKTVPITSATIGIAGVISGSYDLVATIPTNLIQAKNNGGFDVRLIAPRHGYSKEELLRAKKEPLFPGQLLLQTAVIVPQDSKIKSWKDLDNKKIAILTFQGDQHAGVLLAMQSEGVRKPKSEFLSMSSIQMADALKNREVDAVVAIDPIATQLALAGNRIIGYPQAYFQEPDSAAVVFATSSEILSKKTNSMRVFQKATLEINRLLNKSENEASYRKTIADITKVSPEVAAKTRLPLMIEKNITISQLAFIPSKLKKVGFMKGRIELGPIIFR